MTNTTTPPTRKIRGPFWTADVEIVKTADPKSANAFRSLFLELQPRAVDTGVGHLPGTVLLLCFVRKVTITVGSDFVFSRPATDTAPGPSTSAASLRDQVTCGKLALLLCTTDPTGWKANFDASALPDAICLAGDVSLDVLKPENSARSKLYAALTITEAAADQRTGAAHLTGALTAHASGLTAFGRIPVPWEPAPLAAPFQVAKEIPPAAPTAQTNTNPPPASKGKFRITIEEPRLTDDERRAWIAAWGRFARAVDPGNPALPPLPPPAVALAPNWITMDVGGLRRVPPVFWALDPAVTTPPPVRFFDGEIGVLIADQTPHDPERGPTSLARATPKTVTVTKTGTDLTVVLTSGTTTATANLSYLATRGAGGFAESMTLKSLVTAWSAVETPRLVREALGLPTPTWDAGDAQHPATPIAPAALFTSFRLEDGWAQLPVPNLTEQMYLDAGLATTAPAAIPAPLLRGAVVFGNAKPGVLDSRPSEQPWSLTLLDAQKMTGTWTVSLATPDSPSLTKIALDLGGPEVVLDGFLWLAPEPPTVEDALPRLEDWRGGLVSPALTTTDPSDAFPSPIQFAVDTLTLTFQPGNAAVFPSAKLGAWTVRYQADGKTVRSMVDKKVLPDTLFSRTLPLVWRRHGTLPFIQALPLTQSQSPPSHPSSSRQLAPFALAVAADATVGGLLLPTKDWTFGVTDVAQAATSFARLLAGASAAAEWAIDLPMVALSLPGLILDPKIGAGATGLTADASLGLPPQLRYDLPYTDEPNALAEVPRIPRKPGEVGPAPSDPPPPRPHPLLRDDFRDHWKGLSEKASLAAVDSVTFFVADAAGKPQVRGLIEPLQWPVTAPIDAAFPGKITLSNGTGLPVAGSIELKEEAALRGVSGTFVEDGGRLRLGTGANTFDVVAGSAADSVASTGEHRDQRGLLRAASAVTAKTVRTRVRLAEKSAGIDLTSARAAFPLQISAGNSWALWFRDLPCAAGTFLRTDTVSALNEDINDPEARTRAREALSGYEWRLGGSSDPLVIFGLTFVPLTLEFLQFSGDNLIEVQVIGRLQLPLDGAPAGLADLANAVKLVWKAPAGGGTPVLSTVERITPQIEWPLARIAGESGDAPRILWTQVALLPTGLEVRGATIAFSLFDADWGIPLGPLLFTAAATPIVQTYVPVAPGAEPILPAELALALDLKRGVHTLSLRLAITLGQAIKQMPATPVPRPTPLNWQLQTTPGSPPPAIRNAFTADVRFALVGASTASWEKGALFDSLVLVRSPGPPPAGASLDTADRALQFRWTSPDLPATGRPQLLPGMRLRPGDIPGFAAVAFDVLSKAGDVPTLRLQSAFVEAMVPCRWGQFLQADAPATSADNAHLFGSSAGDLAFGYTGQAAGPNWTESLLASGVIEVKNLVSWPLATGISADGLTVTLPAARFTAPLSHLRHTARVLLDQHFLPTDALVNGSGDVVFQIAANRSWQFVAVVEHQLIELVAEGAGVYRPRGDRRLATTQEVRLLTPATFKAALAIANDRMPSTADKTEVIGESSFGVWGKALRDLLTAGTPAPIDALGAALVVEASVLLFANEMPSSPAAPVSLQFLPGGTQLGALSQPNDFLPTDPASPGWALLNLPFLGRLQDESVDGTVDPPPANLTLLQVDPILQIDRRRGSGTALSPLLLALASWGDARAEEFKIAPFDGALGTQFARLDPLSLEESWFRLQLPAADLGDDRLASVLRALPDTPARLGRPVALQRQLDPGRAAYPPVPSPVPDPVDETGAKLEWRPERMLVWQVLANRTPKSTPAYAFHLAVVQLRGFGALAAAPSAKAEIFTHVGVVVLRTNPAQAATPTSLAVSPFVRIGFRAAPLGAPVMSRLPLVSAELLCLDARRGGLISAARHVWQDVDETQRAQLIDDWAHASLQRLCPESPLAIVRERRLRALAAPDAGGAQVLVEYAFASLPPGQGRPRLPRRLYKLRSVVADLRFQDGRFGGADMPVDILPFELAPPQVNGVQPLWLKQRPLLPGETAKPADSDPGRWPFGLSALRMSVQHTEQKRGVAQDVEPAPVTLWWQRPEMAVQYRSALSGLPAAGLPRGFRSGAILSLLPVIPRAPLPPIDARKDLAANDGDRIRRWQPVLPGSTRLMRVGGRAGAFTVWRNSIVRQSALQRSEGSQLGRVMVSGSVPVEQRHPRPVPLEPNRVGDEAVALRTWASAFEATKGLLVTNSPADEAYFAPNATDPEARLAFRLVAPVEGALDSTWNGTLTFRIKPEVRGGAMPSWKVEMRVVVGSAVFLLTSDRDVDAEGSYTFTPSGSGDQKAALRQAVGKSLTGDLLFAEARVATTKAAGAYFQALTFPLLAVRGSGDPLPLAPMFAHFEDPEYNRRLASTAKHAVFSVRDGSSLFTATLSSDRDQYNPDSAVILRHDFDGPAAKGKATLSFARLDANGVPKTLTFGGTESLSLDPDAVAVVPLSELQESVAGAVRKAVFESGQALDVKIKLGFAESELVLPIVAEPVVPRPQAAYALQSRSKDGSVVQCVRFAWGPAPIRIELVNSNDLKTDVVRRRAVFHLLDVIRKNAVGTYAVQKITLSGATHTWDPVTPAV